MKILGVVICILMGAFFGYEVYALIRDIKRKKQNQKKKEELKKLKEEMSDNNVATHNVENKEN